MSKIKALMMQLMSMVLRERRMYLRAFVCSGGTVRWCDDIGSKTLTDVFLARSDSCRFAVVEYVNEPGAWVIDLYELTIKAGTQGDGLAVGQQWHHATLEAAVMAASMREVGS